MSAEQGGEKENIAEGYDMYIFACSSSKMQQNSKQLEKNIDLATAKYNIHCA